MSTEDSSIPRALLGPWTQVEIEVPVKVDKQKQTSRLNAEKRRRAEQKSRTQKKLMHGRTLTAPKAEKRKTHTKAGGSRRIEGGEATPYIQGSEQVLHSSLRASTISWHGMRWVVMNFSYCDKCS